MKFSTAAVLATALPAVSGRFVEENEVNRVMVYPDGSEQETCLIELSPGETRWVTEDEKWEIRRNGQRFFDMTYTEDLGQSARAMAARKKNAVFPSKCHQQDSVRPLLTKLSASEMRSNLEKLTSFHTRFFKSHYGQESSEWLLSRVRETIAEAGGKAAMKRVKAEHFDHPWEQSSIITTIPGRTNNTVVIGAHQDSINLWFPNLLAAPGADDDGSGTVTILEVMRTLLSSEAVVKGEMENTIEFHWYSAEEGGLLGSQAIFKQYESEGREVKAMLQQDMTGFVQKTIDNGHPESVGVITDYVDSGLTDFIKKVITEYCNIPFVETKCGYACSDHASASKAGYPSAFVIEARFEDSDWHIHGTEDLIKYLSFEHMLQHARMTLGLVYELGTADFASLEREEDAWSGEL